MDSQQYKYQAVTRLISGGYPGEEVNTIPANARVITTSALSGKQTYQYFYRDSASLSNANSSRVVLRITDSWTAEFASDNSVTIRVSTTIDSIRRDDIRGNPGAGGTPYRNIYLRLSETGSNIVSFRNDDINTAHTILSSPRSLGANTFVLKPGANVSRSAAYVYNYVPGHESDPLPSIYADALGVGTYFTNPMPPDYRPGAVWGGSTWLSHNRNGGARDIYTGSGWKTMRTENGGVGTGNPPSIVHGNGTWKNMRKIGKE